MLGKKAEVQRCSYVIGILSSKHTNTNVEQIISIQS